MKQNKRHALLVIGLGINHSFLHCSDGSKRENELSSYQVVRVVISHMDACDFHWSVWIFFFKKCLKGFSHSPMQVALSTIAWR